MFNEGGLMKEARYCICQTEKGKFGMVKKKKKIFFTECYPSELAVRKMIKQDISPIDENLLSDFIRELEEKKIA